MTTTIDDPSLRVSVLSASSPETWNDRIRSVGGHLLQSWQWGEFKSRHGWDAERIVVERDGRIGSVQVLFRHAGPYSIAYVPRGPALPNGDVPIARELFVGLDQLCASRRALHLIVEPDTDLPFRGLYSNEGFVRGPGPFQPARTVKVPLVADDELLDQMHSKTRYNVRLAQRRGVQVERAGATKSDVHRFYELMLDTSQRNAFGIHSFEYYADFMEVFGDDALMLFAYVDDQVAAGLIAAKFGSEGVYMYGGSSSAHRAHGAAFLLQYEAMRWAREAGCERYDLWGIPSQDPESTSARGDRVAGTRGEDWRGLYRFKVGFGGEIVSYPQTLERRYRPVLSYLARRRYGRHD